MLLRDHGLLSLDDPVTRWVPELRQIHDTFGAIDAITIRMLLGHSAGFQNPTWPYAEGRPWEPFEPTRWEQLVAMIPNGGWNAPPGDLVQWLRFLTGSTRGDTALARRFDLVLRRSSLEEMWRGRLPYPGPVAGSDSVGLSFFVLHRAQRRFVGHTGSQAGFRSFFYIDPATRSGVIAAFNTSNDVRPDSSAAGFNAVCDAALGMLAAISGSP